MYLIPQGDLRLEARDRGQLRCVEGGDERSAVPPQGGQDGARGVRTCHWQNRVRACILMQCSRNFALHEIIYYLNLLSKC